MNKLSWEAEKFDAIDVLLVSVVGLFFALLYAGASLGPAIQNHWSLRKDWAEDFQIVLGFSSLAGMFGTIAVWILRPRVPAPELAERPSDDTAVDGAIGIFIFPVVIMAAVLLVAYLHN